MAEIPGTPNPETSAAQNIHDTAARAAGVFGALVETMALLRAPVVARGTLSRLTSPSSATWWRNLRGC